MRKVISNSIYLLFLNFLFGIGNYYPRHILESFSLGNVSLIIMNLLFSVFYGYVLIIAFSDINSLKEGFFSGHLKLFNKRILKKLIIFITLHLVIDFALFYIEAFSSEWLYIVSTVMIVLQWLVLYILLTENRRNILKNKAIFYTGVLLILAVTILSLVQDFASMEDFSRISDKYYSDASMFIAEKRIIDFTNQLKLFFVDSVLGILLITLHFLFNKDEKIVNAEKPVGESIFKEVLRVFLVLSLFMIVFGFKDLIAPVGTLEGYTSTNNNSVAQKHVATSGSSITVYKKGINREEIVWYDKNEYSLHLSDSSILKLTAYDNYEYIIKDGQVVSNVYQEVSYGDNIIDAYLFKTKAIIYKIDDGYNAISLENLDSFEYDATVVEVCRKMISEGSIYAFEYVINYLYKYDKDFILPYIERYSRGEFSSLESEWMDLCRYKNEYVIDLAKRY